MACCTRCELALGRTQVVAGVGAPNARLMLIGEAPGAREDREGKPFVGAAGRLLDRLLARNGIPRDQTFITNIVACRPPANRTPRPGEIRAHAGWIEAQVRLVCPEIIATLGRIALTFFIPGARVTALRGTPQEVEFAGRRIPILPLLHPAAALRRRELVAWLEEDFARLARLLDARRTM